MSETILKIIALVLTCLSAISGLIYGNNITSFSWNVTCVILWLILVITEYRNDH
jgi:hypothetical protein